MEGYLSARLVRKPPASAGTTSAASISSTAKAAENVRQKDSVEEETRKPDKGYRRAALEEAQGSFPVSISENPPIFDIAMSDVS